MQIEFFLFMRSLWCFSFLGLDSSVNLNLLLLVQQNVKSHAKELPPIT